MSSPPQSVSMSQFTILSSSPLKPSNFYFQDQDNNSSMIHDEKFNNNEQNDHATDLDDKSAGYLKYPPQSAQIYNHSQNGMDYDISQLQDNNHPQLNLYPPMEFTPHPHRSLSKSPIPTRMKQSESTNTLASHDSVPLLAMSTSMSDTSIASPMSFQNHMATPRRAPNTRRLSATTPFQTPAQNQYSPITVKNGTTPSSSIHKNRRHRRTRSRLSLDATGAASIVTIHHSTSTNSIRSPAAGTNPFYTPPSFLSPLNQNQNINLNESPSATPLATPSGIRKYNSFSSISPNMLMSSHLNEEHQLRANNNAVYVAAADLTVRLASKYTDDSHHPSHEMFANQHLLDYHHHQQQQRNSEHFLSDSIHSELPQRHSFQQHHHNQFSISNDQGLMDQIPEHVSDASSMSNSSSSNSLSSNGPISIQTKGPGQSMRTISISKPLSRSHSSINLSSIIAPPEIKHYDILQPRKKKLNKSNSTTSILETNEQLIKMGKPPKKVHCCPLCNAAFQRPEHVKRHMRSHSSEKPFECDQPGCGKRFNRPDNLKAHLRKIHKCQV